VAAAESARDIACGLEAGPERAVAAVLDATTLRLDDGKEVRLAGVLAPRGEDVGAPPDAWQPAREALSAATTLLVGATVALAFSGRREDRWGQVLAHLFVQRGDEQVWVQARLVADGHVRVHPSVDDGACLGRLVEHERAARAASRGLWSNAAYQIRPADRASELARWRGTFQLVRGTVASVTRTRNLVVVELASSEEARPTAGDRRDRTRSSTSTRLVWRRGLDAEIGGVQLRHGAGLVVRGWIGGAGPPEIEVVAVSQLERD
jgi:endonuclease YncB( thermonuclease family)